MKAIIIDDKDCKALVDKLQLVSLGPLDMVTNAMTRVHNVPEAGAKAMLDSLHRRFHYEVVKWLQEQGWQG